MGLVGSSPVREGGARQVKPGPDGEGQTMIADDWLTGCLCRVREDDIAGETGLGSSERG